MNHTQTPLDVAREFCAGNPEALPTGKYKVVDPLHDKGTDRLLADIAKAPEPAKPYAELTDDERAANVLRAFEPLRALADRFTSADERFLLIPVMEDGRTPMRLAMPRTAADETDAMLACAPNEECNYVAMPLAWAVLAARAYMESQPETYGPVGLNDDEPRAASFGDEVAAAMVKAGAQPIDIDLGDGLGLEVPERFDEFTGGAQ